MNIWEWIKGWFSKLVKAFKQFLAAAIPQVTQIVIARLKDMAVEIVTELADANLTDKEKRSVAFDKIREYAISVGLEAKDSIINLVIELAVQYYKENL